MEKDSALYQLMDTRMHSVMNGIVSSDGEYQAILRKSDIYSGELERMDLSLGSRFGMLAYLLGFSDCKAMFLGKCLPRRRILVSPNKRLSLHAALPLFLIRNNLTGGSYSEKGKTPSPISHLSVSTQ